MIRIDRILAVEEHLDGIEAVIFDLDDTLYSEKEYVRSGYANIAKHFPQIDKMAEKLWWVFQSNGKAIDEVLLSEGIVDPEIKAQCLHLYRFQKPDIHLYSGVEEMLVRLRNLGVKIGIITDGRPEGQNAKLDALGLRPYVDEIIITDALGGIAFRKPNDAAFQIMHDRLNIDFSKMVYVGDNIQKDFLAPKKLGMRAIHFVNSDGLYVCASDK